MKPFSRVYSDVRRLSARLTVVATSFFNSISEFIPDQYGKTRLFYVTYLLNPPNLKRFRCTQLPLKGSLLQCSFRTQTNKCVCAVCKYFRYFQYICFLRFHPGTNYTFIFYTASLAANFEKTFFMCTSLFRKYLIFRFLARRGRVENDVHSPILMEWGILSIHPP